VREALRELQACLARGRYAEADSFLGPSLRERGRSFLKLKDTPEKLRPFLRLKAVRVKIKGDRAFATTDSPVPGFETLEWKRLGGRWVLEGVGTVRTVYPEGKEELYAETARKFAELCFLRERVKYLEALLRRRFFYRSHDSPEEDGLGSRAGKLASSLKKRIGLRRREYLSLLREGRGEEELLSRSLSADLSGFEAEGKDLFEWAERKNLPVPPEAQKAAPGTSALEVLRFGVMVRWFNYEAFPSWKLLGFDFIAVDIGWGPAQVPWREGEPVFYSVGRFVARNSKFGYRSVLSQAGLGPIDFCIWSPAERAKWAKYFRLLGRRFRGRAGTLAYEIFNEIDNRPFLLEKGEEGEYALSAFRAYLKKKYGTVQALNESWETNFRAFSDVLGPYGGVGFGPPQRDFRRFLQESMADLGDSDHPVLTQISEFGGKQDAFLIGSKGVDVFSLHMAFGGEPGGANNMAQAAGLARFLGKELWQEEFIFNWPEAVKTEDPDILAAAINRNVWQAVGWGYKALEFFELDNQWGSWRNSILDRGGKYGIIRSESARIPVTISAVRAVEEVLVDGESVPAEVGIVDSPSTRLNPEAGKRHLRSEEALERFLLDESWSYTYLPEAGLALRPELWEKLKVIVLPDCLYLDSVAASLLLRYAARGGVLVRIGRGGLLDEAARPTALSRYLLARERRLGRGAVFQVRDVGREGPRLAAILKKALGKPFLSVKSLGRVQSFARRAGKAVVVLLINLSAERSTTAKVSLEGSFTEAEDLSARSAPALEKREGRTFFDVFLEPGGAAVVRLEAPSRGGKKSNPAGGR